CWHVSTTDEKTYPAVLDQIQFPKKPFIAVRHLDLEHLRKSGGLNGHVPITYILQSLALIQAIIFNQKTVLTSIGQEGNEPHSMLGDLPVNHQWSKTWEAEQLFAEYVKKYAGRCPVVHLKDFYKEGKAEGMYELIGIEKKEESKGVFEFRPCGYGLQDMPAIVKAAEEAGAKYLVVEQDRSVGRTPMEAVKLSIEYLKN
ncbi:MAG: hypothetical protein IKG51_07430, partial [Firmicutes bacterium]|nr:hypothetical protein [Bacillota bacterium]